MPFEELEPLAKPRIMDLVERTGIDVGPWALRADGSLVEHPAANPAYCYEWCFTNSARVVFSLWFDNLAAESGRILQRVNMRDLRRRIERAEHLDKGTRTANLRRAMAVDSAVQLAFKRKLPVRVIVCDGDRRDLEDLARRDPSRVELRLLDPSPWHVASYDFRGQLAGGNAEIIRDHPLGWSQG